MEAELVRSTKCSPDREDDTTSCRSPSAATTAVPKRPDAPTTSTFIRHPSRPGQPGTLVLDDGRVELGEDRRRLLDRRPDSDRPGLPPWRPRVVAGDHRVAQQTGPLVGVELLDVLDPRHRLELALTAERLPHLRGRVRQERRQHRVAVEHALPG